MSDGRMSKARESLIQQFIEALEQDQLPWTKGWVDLEPPVNAEQNRRYSGVNRLVLSLAASQKGFSDNRWCTFATAKRNGWHVKKGEKGSPIEIWKMYRTDTKETLDFLEAGRLLQENPELKPYFRPFSKNYTVFNAQQIDGIPPLEKKEVSHEKVDASQFVTQALNSMGVDVIHGGSRAYYELLSDSIHIPEPSQFLSQYEYNATLLHETCHATGHSSRLNRDMRGSFGSEKYAKEELRAEISSAFLMQDLGLKYDNKHIENHKAYIQSWISVLKKDENELFSAIKDAHGISDYVNKQAEKNIEVKKEQNKIPTKITISPTERTDVPFNVQHWSDVQNNGQYLYAGVGKYCSTKEEVVNYLKEQSAKVDIVSIESNVDGVIFNVEPQKEPGTRVQGGRDSRNKMSLNDIKSRAKQRASQAEHAPKKEPTRNKGMDR